MVVKVAFVLACIQVTTIQSILTHDGKKYQHKPQIYIDPLKIADKWNYNLYWLPYMIKNQTVEEKCIYLNNLCTTFLDMEKRPQGNVQMAITFNLHEHISNNSAAQTLATNPFIFQLALKCLEHVYYNHRNPILYSIVEQAIAEGKIDAAPLALQSLATKELIRREVLRRNWH